MNNQELLQAVKTLLIQGQNNYHLSKHDIQQADYAMQVLNSLLATAKNLPEYKELNS